MEGIVTVINGVNTLDAELVGSTVAQIRSRVSEAMNIDPQAGTQVDGVAVSSSHVLEDGDVLEFVKASGVKGY